MSEATTPNLLVDKQERNVLDTLGLLFKSRRVLLGIAGLIIVALVTLVPALAPLQPHIAEIIFVIVALVAGFTVEDSVQIWAGRGADPKNLREAIEGALVPILNEILPDTIEKTVEELLDAALDEYLGADDDDVVLPPVEPPIIPPVESPVETLPAPSNDEIG